MDVRETSHSDARQKDGLGVGTSSPTQGNNLIPLQNLKLLSGRLQMAPSITARRIQMQICNIQRGFQLVVGANGGWTGEAQAKLLQWLLKSEQKRARTATASRSPCPALEDHRLALEDKKPDEQPQDQRLTLEDKKPDEQLAASSSPQAPVPIGFDR